MSFLRRQPRQAELERLLQGRPNFRVVFSKTQLAASLWDYGEDELAHRALAMSDRELSDVRAIAAWYEDPAYPLPVEGQRITHNHVNALAAITLFEGQVRALNRTRRRAQRDRPEHFRPEPPAPGEPFPTAH
jgi:hypothetical protein